MDEQKQPNRWSVILAASGRGWGPTVRACVLILCMAIAAAVPAAVLAVLYGGR